MPLIPSTPDNEELERMFGYFAKRGSIDLQNQNAPPERRAELTARRGELLANQPSALDYLKQSNPAVLRELARTHIFAHLPGFSDIGIEHIAVAPQTSTQFLAFAQTEAVRMADHPDNPVVLNSQGNYRKNGYRMEISGGKIEMGLIPINPTTCKISAKGLLRTIRECRAQGKDPVIFQFETPSNPWMQVYSPEEMKAIGKVAQEEGLLVVNDLYLIQTEGRHMQIPLTAVMDDSSNILTTYGLRRVYGQDDSGKSGFAVSHNEELIGKMAGYSKALQIVFTQGELAIALDTIERLSINDITRNALHLAQLRESAEGRIREIDGLRVVVPAQAGPFVVMGFSEEMQERMQACGLSGGFRAAEYFAAKGVCLMPVEICFTDIHKDAFRVNVTHNFEPGLERIKTAVGDIRDGVSYDSVRADIAKAYAAPTPGHKTR